MDRAKSTLEMKNFHAVFNDCPSHQYLQNVMSVSASSLDKPGVLAGYCSGPPDKDLLNIKRI